MTQDEREELLFRLRQIKAEQCEGKALPAGDVGEPAERQYRYRPKGHDVEWSKWHRYVGEITESMLANLDVETRELYAADALAAQAAKLAELEQSRERWANQFDEANADVIRLNSKLQDAQARLAECERREEHIIKVHEAYLEAGGNWKARTERLEGYIGQALSMLPNSPYMASERLLEALFTPSPAPKPKVVCHASGDRCHGCAHYRGEAPVCEYASPAPEAGHIREVTKKVEPKTARKRQYEALLHSNPHKGRR